MSFGAPGPGLQVRVLLVLSQPVVASALRERIAIEPNLTVVAETTDELSVPTLLDHHAVDVVVIDGRLPGGGLALVSAVRARATASVIVLADACDGPTVVDLVRRLSAELRPGVLDKLGLTAALQWLAGELEAAARGTLPDLVTVEALCGTLHNHSTWSDGAHSLREMADAARARGLEYFALCDHSRSLKVPDGRSVTPTSK